MVNKVNNNSDVQNGVTKEKEVLHGLEANFY